MYSSSGGDARSAASFNARDSPTSMPSDHPPSWDRQVCGREKFDRTDRDRHVPGKEWLSDRPSSSQSSHRTCAVLPVNGSLPGPPSKRRAPGRYGAVENGRYGITTGRASDSSAFRGISSPVGNGKVERDASVLSGGRSPGFSESPGTERLNKVLDGHPSREPCHSPADGRPTSSPSPDLASRPCGAQSTHEGSGSWDRERSKFCSPHRLDREWDCKDRTIVKGQFYRRAGSLPKLDPGRDWSLGDGELEGRLDRYGIASTREHAFPDVLSGSKEHSRHDWRVRDKALLSSETPAYPSNDGHQKGTSTQPLGSEVSGIPTSPHHYHQLSSTGHESRDNVGHVSPRKRPRLTWGQGLAKYEKEKVEEDPMVTKKSEEGIKDNGLFTRNSSMPASSQNNRCLQPGQNHSPGVIESFLEIEPSPSRIQDSVVHARQEMSTRQTMADEQGENDRNFDVRQERAPQLMSEHLVLTTRTSQPSVLDDTLALLASFCENTSNVSKEFLMEKVEKLEFEIDVVEKDLVKLASQYEIQEISVKATEIDIETPAAKDCTLLPLSCAVSSPAACTQNEHMASTPAVGVAFEGSVEKDAQQCEAQDNKDMNEDEAHVPEIVVESFMSDCQKVDVEVSEVNWSTDSPALQPQKNPMCEMMDQGSSVDHGRECVSRLLQANQEMAKLSWTTLSHLLPKCYEPGVGMIDGEFYSSPQEAGVWKRNVESHERKRKFLECKVAQENSFLKFAARVLAVKYRALRETWKQDLIGNVQRKDRAKALRRRDPERCNGSVPPSQRLSLRLHPVTCPSTVDEIQVVRRLLSELPMDSQRAYLKMPSMLLDNKERALHRFVTKNALVEDPIAVEQERKDMNPWTVEEKKVFMDKFSLFGKNFNKIATFLEHKTVADCVQYYYRNQKSSEDFEKAPRKHQLKKRRDYSQSSASYLATMTSVSSRRREVNDARAEGLTLMAAAAAAMSVPRDFPKVVRSTSRIVERARHLSAESGNPDASCKPMNGKEKSAMNDFSGLVGLSSAVTSLKVCRDRNSNKQGGSFIVPAGKSSHAEQLKGARSMHSRTVKGYFEEVDSQWTETERQLFTAAVTLFGKDFHSISLHVGSKNQDQCKAFFSKTQKRLGLDNLVECYKATSQLDAKVTGSLDGIKYSQNSEAIVNSSLNDICSKPWVTQDSERMQDERSEQQGRTDENLTDVEASVLNDSSDMFKGQDVNASAQEDSVFGQNGIVNPLKSFQTGTEGGPIDDIMPVSSDCCKEMPSACNHAVKQEVYSSIDNKELPTGSSRVDAVQSSTQDASSVCIGSVELQMEPVNIKMEAVSTPNTAQDRNPTTPHLVPMSGMSSAVPTPFPSSLTAASMAKPALVKDKGLKVMETRTRREPTSWTQEEKDTFIDIIRKYGRDWAILNESLPAKSLTQIKTYFQNSKAKLGLASEGTVNGSGRGSLSRKRKVDDSDSSSNAGSVGQIVPQQVVMHANEGSIKAGSNMLGPSSGTSEALGGNMVGVEALAYATLFGRNSNQLLEDSISTQKLFHPMGLPQNSTASGTVPLFNPAVFAAPGLHSVQQSYAHPTSPHQTQQLVSHQQPQSSLAPLMLQPLQQEVSSIGIQQANQLQQQQAISGTHQDLPISVVQHLHKQAIQQPNSQTLLQQQQQKQLVEHLQQQVVEAVLQQQLQPHLAQRQQQLQLSAQLPHHLQQVLNHHQVQFSQQLSTQAVSQQPQSGQASVCNQIVGPGSQSKAAAHHQQQPAQAQSQLYQTHSLSQSLMHQQQTSQQQLQQLQMQLQQDQLQAQRQQQIQAQQLQKASLGSSQLQPQNSRLLHEQQLQQLAILRGLCMQTSSTSSEVSKKCEYDLQTSLKLPQVNYQGLQPLLVPKNSMQTSPKSQFTSDVQVRAADVKLFGRSLLVQPASGSQQTNSRVSSTSSQAALSTAPPSFNTAKSSSDTPSYGHGLAGNSVMQSQGWPAVVWPGPSIGSSGPGSTLASILQGSSATKIMDGESEPHNIQEAVACMTERLIQGANVFENGCAANLAALSQLAGVNDGIPNVFSSLEHGALSEAAIPRYLPSEEVNRLDNDSNACDQLQVSGQGMPPSSNSGPDFKGQAVTIPGGPASSQGLRPVLDALVALAEWRLHSSGRLTEEIPSKSWEALRRDPNTLVEEAGKVGGILGQSFVSGPEVQYFRDGRFYSQPHLMHSQMLHSSVAGGPWVSSNAMHAADTQQVIPPASSFHLHNIAHNLVGTDEQGRLESQDLDGCGAVG